MNHKVDKIARPENVWTRIDSEFLLLIRPASKNPKAGVISITRPVEISIQVVSPVSMAILRGQNKLQGIYKTSSEQLPNACSRSEDTISDLLLEQNSIFIDKLTS